MVYKYATQNLTERHAKAVALSQHVSVKQSLEIARFIKKKTVAKAKAYLEAVVKQEKAIPYTKFNKGVGHKAGMAAGRYPVKAAEQMIALLDVVVANAEDKSLDKEKLIVDSVVVQKASKSYRYGRIRGRKFKNAHIELVVVEAEAKKTEKKTVKKAPVKKTTAPKKEDTKVTEKKATPKAEVNAETKKEVADKKMEGDA